jgi:hypothetical protein
MPTAVEASVPVLRSPRTTAGDPAPAPPVHVILRRGARLLRPPGWWIAKANHPASHQRPVPLMVPRPPVERGSRRTRTSCAPQWRDRSPPVMPTAAEASVPARRSPRTTARDPAPALPVHVIPVGAPTRGPRPVASPRPHPRHSRARMALRVTAPPRAKIATPPPPGGTHGSPALLNVFLQPACPPWRGANLGFEARLWAAADTGGVAAIGGLGKRDCGIIDETCQR